MSTIIEHAAAFAAWTDGYEPIWGPVRFTAKTISTCFLGEVVDPSEIGTFTVLRRITTKSPVRAAGKC